MTSPWITTGLSIAFMMSSSNLVHPEVAYTFAQASQRMQKDATQGSPSNTDRFSLNVEVAHPIPHNDAEVALEITVTNLTDDVLLLSSFRGRVSDSRVFLEKGSTPLKQREQLENGSFPIGRLGPGMATKPHAITRELTSLTHLYRMSNGTYHAYVMMRDPLTKRLIRSNTVSFEYSATQTTNAK